MNWLQNKEAYRKFCQGQEGLPIFFQDWWLDVVCGEENWEVCLSKDKAGNIQGVLPFYWSRYFGMKVIIMPKLTPYLGAWLKYPKTESKQKPHHRFEKRVIEDLIDQRPKVFYYAQRHPVQLVNWLPFYWKGFKQTTYYTFRIEYPIKLLGLSNLISRTAF